MHATLVSEYSGFGCNQPGTGVIVDEGPPTGTPEPLDGERHGTDQGRSTLALAGRFDGRSTGKVREALYDTSIGTTDRRTSSST